MLERWPRAALDLVVRRGHEVLPLPRRGRILAYDASAAGPGGFGAGLRRGRYDRFYVLPPSFSSAWMAFRSGAPERVGYGGQLRGPLLRPALRHHAAPRSVHIAREYLDLLDPGLELDCYPPRLEAPAPWIERALGPLCRRLPERFAALAPGAAYGPAKAWPLEHFRELALGLRERAGLPVVVVGGGAERGLGERVREGLEGVVSWCGETDLAGLVAVLARAALLVSNDSGAMHVMAALGRPQVAIFGSTSPAWTRPLNPRAAVLHAGEPCSPCFRRTCPRGHYRCLRGISPETALEAALALLEGRTPRA